MKLIKPKNKQKQSTKPLRIVAGKWRGRKINFVDAQGLRPTLDRVRETLFNWLQRDIYDAICLDLFAGSGALALEALSRGAKHVTLVDINIATTAQIKHNLSLLACSDASVYTQSAMDFLQQQISQQQTAQQQSCYDVVFLDPPFHKQYLAPICERLETGSFLHNNSLVYIEVEDTLDMTLLPQNWNMVKEKNSSQFSYYLFERC